MEVLVVDDVVLAVGGGRCVDSVGCCHAHLSSLASIPLNHSFLTPLHPQIGGHVTHFLDIERKEKKGAEQTDRIAFGRKKQNTTHSNCNAPT